MNIISKICLGILLLLSIASGAAKVFLAPQEVEFFGGAGFSNFQIVAYGISQIIGGALLVPRASRTIAAFYLAANFLGSAAVIALSGDIPFALFSLLPVIVSLVLGVVTLRTVGERVGAEDRSGQPTS